MPIDPKEALEVLGYDAEKFDDVEAFRAQAEKDWLKASEAPMNKEVQRHVFGKINGALRTTIKQSARDLDVDGEWDTLDPIDGVKALSAEVSKKLRDLREAQEALKAGTTPTKEVAEVKRQYDEAKRKLEDLTKLYDESTSKYTALETSVAKEKEQAKVDAIYNAALGKLTLRKMTAFERDGFEAALRRDNVVKFDDEGLPYVVGKDGERIRDEKKAHGYLTVDEALKAYAEANGLTEKAAPESQQRRTIPLTEGEQGNKGRATPVGERVLRPVASRV